MDQHDSVFTGALLIDEGRIVAFNPQNISPQTTIDARGCAVLPGFVQAHVHLCQTIFRAAADDLSLIDWLKKRIWPLEAAHTAESIRASARLGIAELIKGGTTCALTMETVNHTDEVFRVVDETGFRATVGKCMMDSGEDVPESLLESTETSLQRSIELLEAWHGKANGRIRYCFAPRFAISCSRDLLAQVARLAVEHGVMIHTHASENAKECELVEQATGMRNILYLDSLGLSGRHVALAHCVHLDEREMQTLALTETNVVHCPSSNLKLGSGIAPVTSMLELGISVALGADGAACNNRLDMFTEMRTAALLQKAIHGPESLAATRVLRMATIDGARALGLQNEIGSLETGKRADVIVVRMNSIHSAPTTNNPASILVYSAQPADVEAVIIDGELVVGKGKMLIMDEQSVVEEANHEAKRLFDRAGLR